MGFDVSQVIAQILGALEAEISEGWQLVSSFAEKQTRLLANHALMITQSRTTGLLKDNDELFDVLVQQLKELTENFARSLASLTIITLEKAWNAIVRVVWGAINGAVGAAGLAVLPLPRAPAVLQ